MKIFVSGATGFQGGNIAQQLLAKSHEVVTLKRDLKNGIPAAPGIEVIEGNLDNKDALQTALKGAQAAVYTLPLIFNMEMAKKYTSNFIEVAQNEEIPLVVFNAGFDLPQNESDLLALNLKTAVKDLLDASGLNVITLVPNIYIDNLSAPWSVPVILNNHILPYPIASGKKIPWISHFDLAKYVASAVEKPELAGKTLSIGGNLFTGEEIATAISSKITKTVNFVSVAPDDFEQQLTPGFGELAAKEISNLYRYVEQNYSAFKNKDFAKTNEILGVNPQSLEDWVNSVNWSI